MPMRSFLKESSAHTLCAGDLEAVFLPDHGMLGASLRYKGVEILRRAAKLEWSSSDLLAVFPFRHCVELAATLCPESLTVETTLVASSETAYKVHEINKIRKINKLNPISIITVNILKAEDGSAISSTRIRAGEIDASGKILRRTKGKK